MRKIDWPKYYENLTLGVKVYLIKDDMSQLPKAIQLQKRYVETTNVTPSLEINL